MYGTTLQAGKASNKSFKKQGKEMAKYDYDIGIIGGGSDRHLGFSVAGAKILLIENEKELGWPQLHCRSGQYLCA